MGKDEKDKILINNNFADYTCCQNNFVRSNFLLLAFSIHKLAISEIVNTLTFNSLPYKELEHA